MDKLEKLLQIIDQLLGPQGCAWDRKQTLQSMRTSLLEETYEFLHSIDSEDYQHACEELGDLLMNVLFLARLGEKEGHFSLDEVTETISEKLIRRHPHVFGEGKAIESPEEVLKQWDEIKKQEKGQKQSTKPTFEEFRKELPSLNRAQKLIKRLTKEGYTFKQSDSPKDEEEAFGHELLQLLLIAHAEKIDADNSLRKALAYHEQKFLEDQELIS